VTVVFEFSVTVQAVSLEDVHPLHEEKVLVPVIEGAVRVTVVPALYVSE
jgi:hypothetical protein